MSGYEKEFIPVAYCVNPEVAALIIDTAIELGAPIEAGARTGEAWQFALGYVVGRAVAGGKK